MTSSIKNWSPSNSSDFGSNWFDCLFGHMARFNHNFFANLNASLNTEQCFGFWGRGLFLMLSLVPTLLFPLQLGVTFSLSTSYLTFWVISPDFQVWLSPPCQTNKQKQKNKKSFLPYHTTWSLASEHEQTYSECHTSAVHLQPCRGAGGGWAWAPDVGFLCWPGWMHFCHQGWMSLYINIRDPQAQARPSSQRPLWILLKGRCCLLIPLPAFSAEVLESEAETCGLLLSFCTQTVAHFSGCSFCWGKGPSICVWVSHFCCEMGSKKGPGNRDAFSFQDKSKQTLKLTRFCCLWLIHTVCILALLKSVALFSLVYWELSFMLMNLLCRKSDKRNWRAAQGWVINKWGLSLLSGDAAHDLDSGASRPHPGTSTPAPCLGALFTDYS